MMENLHLLKTGRGTYFDRNINILSWTNDSKVIVGRYCSIARDCTFLLNANHRPDWVTTSTMLLGLVNPEIDEYLNHTLGHNSSRGDIVIGNDVWIY
jgi:acetyltransferase-like isoleucine patch superfamily enzyme